MSIQQVHVYTTKKYHMGVAPSCGPVQRGLPELSRPGPHVGPGLQQKLHARKTPLAAGAVEGHVAVP